MWYLIPASTSLTFGWWKYVWTGLIACVNIVSCINKLLLLLRTSKFQSDVISSYIYNYIYYIHLLLCVGIGDKHSVFHDASRLGINAHGGCVDTAAMGFRLCTNGNPQLLNDEPMHKWNYDNVSASFITKTLPCSKGNMLTLLLLLLLSVELGPFVEDTYCLPIFAWVRRGYYRKTQLSALKICHPGENACLWEYAFYKCTVRSNFWDGD